MLYKIYIWLKKPKNTLWILPSLGVIFAVLFIFLAFVVTIYLPENLFIKIEKSILIDLLDVLASSMLGVVTFSLSIMVSAFSSASNNATPRATELIMADDNTRITISSFISAFIYSIIAKVALGIGYFGQNGIFILFISTICVLFYLIFALIRWIQTLSNLGRLSNTTHKIYDATDKAFKNYKQNPNLGCCFDPKDKEPNAVIYAKNTGYITHINLSLIYNMSKKFGFKIFISARDGDYISKSDEIAFLYFDEKFENEDVFEQIEKNIIIEDERNFEKDPRFGFIVLSEVAQKALSPAINDQGTAFSVLNLISKILTQDIQKADEAQLYKFETIGIKSLNDGDFITQSIDAISRDGATNAELILRIFKSLFAIYKNSDKDMQDIVLTQARISLNRALEANSNEFDKLRLKQKYDEFFIKFS